MIQKKRKKKKEKSTRTQVQRYLWRKQNYTTGPREQAIIPSPSGMEQTAHLTRRILTPPSRTHRQGWKTTGKQETIGQPLP